jgi:HK97 family phage major capsid protein
LIRFGRSELAQEIFQDVKDKIRKHMSVGYERLKTISAETKEGGRRCIRFAWRPFELSVVPVPADPGVGIGRSKDKHRTMANDEAAFLCREAWSACNEAIGEFEECSSGADAAHQKAIELARDAIAALVITWEDVQFWSEATAADCVAVCAECASYCDQAIAALRAVGACANCGSCANDAIHELEEAAEACRENAGLPVKDPAMAIEGDLEAETASLQSEGEQGGTVVDADTRTKTAPNVDAPILPNADAANATDKNRQTNMSEAATTTTAAPPAATPDLKVVRSETIDAERNRVKLIRTAVEKVSKDFPDATEQLRSMANTAIDEGKEPADFNADLLGALPGMRKTTMMTCENLGMSRRDVKEYSFLRAIQSVVKRHENGGGLLPDGIEGEVHKEMAKRVKEGGAAVAASGFWVPPDIGLRVTPERWQQRDLNVTTFGQGGAMVQTSILTPIIEILRNRMVTNRLGVQGMAGLEGNVAIPRQTGAATGYSLAESATLTKSTQALDQVLLTPHRIGAYNEYTKQLLLQSSVDVENFIRDDLMKVIAIKWDKMILEGSGAASEPTGILHTDGIGSVHFGAAPTFAKLVAFETALALANADLGAMAYVTSPSVRGALKVTPKVPNSTFPIFVWEPGKFGDGSNDGEINSYRAAATNQIAGNLVAFGNWSDCIHALWGGYDVVVNPYTRDTDAVVRITVNTFGDVAVRHAASFAWSDDAGNQS